MDIIKDYEHIGNESLYEDWRAFVYRFHQYRQLAEKYRKKAGLVYELRQITCLLFAFK